MKASYRYRLNRLAETLVTTERYGPTWPNFLAQQRVADFGAYQRAKRTIKRSTTIFDQFEKEGRSI